MVIIYFYILVEEKLIFSYYSIYLAIIDNYRWPFFLSTWGCSITIVNCFEYVIQIEYYNWIFIEENQDADGDNLGIQNQFLSISCFPLMKRSECMHLYENKSLPSILPTAYVHLKDKTYKPFRINV